MRWLVPYLLAEWPRRLLLRRGGGDCYSTPTCQPAPCKDRVLCKGQAKGVEKMCGPCAPTIKWAGKWMTIEKCPAAPKVEKKVAKKAEKQGKFVK